MKNATIKISIPTPCHEDWNKMTPNEKGSFCGKCCKTVVDFTGKTPEEIRSTLLAEAGKKVCGRFKPDQLDEPPKATLNLSIPFSLLPKNISYRKAFALALFIVFGTSLFSCRTTEDHLVGDIAVEAHPIQPDSTQPITCNDTALRVGQGLTEPVNGNIQLKVGEVSVAPDSTSTEKPLPVEPKLGKIKIKKEK